MTSTADESHLPLTVVAWESSSPTHSVTSPESVISDLTTASRKNVKQKQAAAQGTVTNILNELKRLMSNKDTDIQLVKENLITFDKGIETFQNAYQEHLSYVKDGAIRRSVAKKFTRKMKEFNEFHCIVSKWIQECEVKLQDSMRSVSEVSSYTSNRSKSVLSRDSSSSYASSIQSQLLQATLESAVLAAEKSALEKRLDLEASLIQQQEQLEQQQRQVEQQQRQLELALKRHQAVADLDVKIAKANAVESVLRESLSNIASSCVSKHVPSSEVECTPVRAPVHVLPSSPSVCKPAPPLVLPCSDTMPVDSRPPKLMTDVAATSSVSAEVCQGHSQHPPPMSYSTMVSALRLPQLLPPKFNGDPKTFHTFMIAFNSQITALTDNDVDRLYYLNQFLEGEAQTLVARCLLMDAKEGFAEAMRLLKRKYGDPYKVSTCYTDRIVSWPVIHTDDGVGLENFAVFLRECQQALKTASDLPSLNHTRNLQIIVYKLPNHLQNKWRDHVRQLRRGSHPCDFDELCSFIEDAADAANDPVYSKEAISKTCSPSQTSVKSQSSFATAVNESTGISTVKCLYCSHTHDIDTCALFNGLSNDEKRKFLLQNRRCFGCYGSDHFARDCNQRRVCKTCSKMHPTALHITGFILNRNGGRQDTSIQDTG